MWITCEIAFLLISTYFSSVGINDGKLMFLNFAFILNKYSSFLSCIHLIFEEKYFSEKWYAATENYWSFKTHNSLNKEEQPIKVNSDQVFKIFGYIRTKKNSL